MVSYQVNLAINIYIIYMYIFIVSLHVHCTVCPYLQWYIYPPPFIPPINGDNDHIYMLPCHKGSLALFLFPPHYVSLSIFAPFVSLSLFKVYIPPPLMVLILDGNMSHKHEEKLVFSVKNPDLWLLLIWSNALNRSNNVRILLPSSYHLI